MTKTLFVLTCWKPYEPVENIHRFIENHLQESSSVIQYALAVPYAYLKDLSQKYSSADILFGALEMLNADKGSFTEAVAGKVLKLSGAAFVLIGTNQERTTYGLTDVSIHLKLLEALKEGVTPILCVGENAEEFEQGLGEKVVEEQLRGALEGIPPDQAKLITVFFESPWAVRQPWRPSVQELEQEFDRNRQILEKVAGRETAGEMRVIRTIPEDLPDFHPAGSPAVFASHHHVPGLSKKALEAPVEQKKEPETSSEYASLLEEQEPAAAAPEHQVQTEQGEAETTTNPPEEQPISVAEFLAEEEVAVVDTEEEAEAVSGAEELELPGAPETVLAEETELEVKEAEKDSIEKPTAIEENKAGLEEEHEEIKAVPAGQTDIEDTISLEEVENLEKKDVPPMTEETLPSSENAPVSDVIQTSEQPQEPKPSKPRKVRKDHTISDINN